MDQRYLDAEEKFLPFAYAALADHFDSIEALRAFYEAIPGRASRNEFLRICGFYLFIVKHGDFVSAVPGEAPQAVEYISNSYKTIGMLALIESLGASSAHTSFYDYLQRKGAHSEYPILDRNSLKERHSRYLKECPSSKQRTIAFIAHSGAEGAAIISERVALLKSREVADLRKARSAKQELDPGYERRLSIREFAEYLYQSRSDFVHRARLLVERESNPHPRRLSREGKKYIFDAMTQADLQRIFELALVGYFSSVSERDSAVAADE